MKYIVPLLACFLLCLSGCSKNHKATSHLKKDDQIILKIKNITPRTLFAASFAHMKAKFSSRWRWHKSAVVTLEPEKTVSLSLGELSNPKDLMDVYGALGIFTHKADADEAIYELLPDKNKLDLDQIGKIGEKEIVIGVEKYGITGDIFDYDFIEPSDVEIVDELDFVVENQTGRDIYAAGFVYQMKDDMPVWHYDKTPIIFIKNGESGVIDVDTLVKSYDRKYMRGYLAIFDKSEKEQAVKATYPLLKAYQKLRLGRLAALQSKKVIINDQKYGILGDIIDFTIKEPRKISFGKKAHSAATS